MNMMTITGLAIVAVALGTVLKQKNPEYSLAAFADGGRADPGDDHHLRAAAFRTDPVPFRGDGAKAEYVQILFKALGLCFITQIACDACRDLGETAIASKVETAGKLSVLLVSLPLFEKILGIAGGLIGGAG